MRLAIYTDIKNGYYFHGMMATEAGVVIPTHRHASYRHRLKVVRGKIRLWSETGGEEILSAGQMRSIPAGVGHDIEFLEPGFACCVHRLFDDEGRAYPFDYELTPRERASATARL